MARIRICLEDDQGQPLLPGTEQVYALAGACNTLDTIEQAVEDWRKKALPDIEKTLLLSAQQEAIAKKKAT